MKNNLKKILDKHSKRVYNIRIEGRGKFSLNTDLEKAIREHRKKEEANNKYLLSPERYALGLAAASAMISRVYEKHQKYLPIAPVFAGGYFRDMFSGRHPKDLDIFINTHGMSEEEQEDNITLFADDLRELAEVHMVERHQAGTDYDFKKGKESGSKFLNKGVFTIYNCYVNADAGIPCSLQIIGRDMGPPEEEDPLYATKDFYAGNVRAAMTLDGNIHLDPAFLAYAEDFKAILYEEHAYDKLVNNLLPYSTFEVVNAYEKKADLDPKKLREEKWRKVRFENINPGNQAGWRQVPVQQANAAAQQMWNNEAFEEFLRRHEDPAQINRINPVRNEFWLGDDDD